MITKDTKLDTTPFSGVVAGCEKAWARGRVLVAG